jgi:uncharacterized protein (TIGR02284 family)
MANVRTEQEMYARGAGGKVSLIPRLNRLITICKDGEFGFKTAAEDVRVPELQTLFRRYAAQRAMFASDLQRAVVNLGGEPEDQGSLTGLMHREWMDVKSAVTERSAASILDECVRGEETAVKAYAEALHQPLAPELEDTIRQQYTAILTARENVRSLRITRRSG